MSEIKHFRLLIIGKTGCGKTTILSKVCGEDVADQPSTMRGVHDIERELRFRHNDKLIAHDSEGFEAGQTNEIGVVSDFIERRAILEDINDRLHIVWYCIEVNSRPIQHAEREFFSTLKQVPVITIFTKFDVFVQDVLQELEEAADEEGQVVDEDTLEQQAAEEAENRFNEYYRAQLQELPHPPKAIVTLSNTDKSQPNDPKLGELIQQTVAALDPKDDADITDEQRKEQRKLKEIFVIAQTADLTVKVDQSLRMGMGDNYNKLGTRPINREGIIGPWSTIWSYGHSQMLSGWLNLELQRNIDYSPRLIGHPESHDLLQFVQWSQPLQLCAQLEHMVIDTVIIMKHIYLLRAQDQYTIQKIIEWYAMQSTSAKQIRKTLVDMHNRDPGTLIGLKYGVLNHLIHRLQVEVPVIPPPPPEPQAVQPVGRMAKLFKKVGKRHK